MSNIDYTPVILAQLTDLQMRATKQDATITALKAEIERLTGKSINISDASTMRTSIPLRPKPYSDNNRSRHTHPSDGNSKYPPQTTGRTRPKVANTERTPYPTMSLSDVLKTGEEVIIKIRLPNDATTVAVATFDGAELNVTNCTLAPSIIGLRTAKPGEILYKFMEELKNGGHITRTFSSPPWRLCFVERDGVTKSLEELRTVGG